MGGGKWADFAPLILFVLSIFDRGAFSDVLLYFALFSTSRNIELQRIMHSFNLKYK